MIEVHIRHGQMQREAPYGLTELGKEQAKAAAEYLHINFPRGFSVGFQSPSMRAKETTALLGYSDTSWYTDDRLRELSWGEQPPKDVDSLSKTPEYQTFTWRNHPTGESWEEVGTRLTTFFAEVDATHPDGDRIFSYHGNALRTTRFLRELREPALFVKTFEEPYKYFTNCQIIIYSNENPETGEISAGERWVKSVCPWDLERNGHDWLLI